MRHNKAVNHLGRTSSHRKALMANMATSLILKKRIFTTVAKAKALRTYVEPLITKTKEDNTNNRRTVFSYLQDKAAVAELFRDIAPKVASRPGGYTRILKTGTRLGDNAEMCLIELVDFNESYMQNKGEKKAKTTRRRRSTGRKKAEVEEAVVGPEIEAKAENKE
ncbi:MAG TPA: 50S ribosomal protein L17 [Bacteroidales bacterium]